MKNIISEIMISSPDTGNLLEYREGFLSDDHDTEKFPVKEGIPLMLPGKPGEGMDYIGHYTTDAEQFDYFSERICKETEHGERRSREFIASRVPEKTQLLLDVGSGSAWAAKKFCPDGIKVVSMDISLKNIKTALERIPHENHYGIVGDGLNPPFPEDSFDCVIAAEVIEHTVDPADFAVNLFRLVKPGGKLIISTPYKEKIQYYLCVHCNKPTPKNAHLHSFDENKLSSLIPAGGVSSVKHFTFLNKALTIMRAGHILRFLPFGLWKIADSLANLIINKKTNIIIEFVKNAK